MLHDCSLYVNFSEVCYLKEQLGREELRNAFNYIVTVVMAHTLMSFVKNILDV